MADYAIGDIQGCYESFRQLLEKIHFDEKTDRLWFVGDLVNRGPQSLEVLRFIKNLAVKPRITLGNHDLYFLARLFTDLKHSNSDDTLHALLCAPDRYELGHWLRGQSILYHDMSLNIVMCHAGIAPNWTLTQAKALAKELESALQGAQYQNFLAHMFGHHPQYWSPHLTGNDRLRVICNYFTRMRCCNAQGHLELHYKGSPLTAPQGLYPWYAVPHRTEIEADIVFGHWAALEGKCPHPKIYAVDTGCLWGGPLTALRLQDKYLTAIP